MYPLIAYTLNKIAIMEVEFLNRELAANEIEALPVAINEDEGSLPFRRTTFEESRNADHQVRYRKLF